MPPTTRKRQQPVVEAPTVPVTRAKRKAAQRKNPSTSTSTTRPRRRPAATTAPRKTAYKDKRGQTPALPTVEASSDGETEEATEEEASPRPTSDESSNDGNGRTEPAGIPRKRKAGARGGAEPEEVIDSQVNDTSSDDSEEAIVAHNLLTPQKRQKRRRASSDEEEEQDAGDVTARAGTVIPETDYEGPVFTSPRKAGQRTYGKQKRPDKGKGKAVDPSPSPPAAQRGPAEEEEAGDSDRSAGSDGREDEEGAAQQQPVASTSRKPSQKKSSGNTAHRSPPKKRVLASASQKSPARRPASSSHQAHNSPAKKKTQQRQDPAPDTDSASSEGEGQPSRQRKSPRRRFELASSDDEATDDGENETKAMYPPEIFQHPDFTEAEDGGRRRGWVSDRIWVHDHWASPGRREKVIAFIEENGGRVVKSMKKAQIAILPHWFFDETKELYDEAKAAGAFPVLYAWVEDCARRSVKEGRAVRLSRDKYRARLPGTRTDGRLKRYLRLTYEETEKFARLYARWTRKEISRGEMLERMQNQFFDGTIRTTIDGFDACLKENEQQIKSLAKKINREAARQYTDSEADGDATDAAARTEDEAYEGMRRSRSQSRSQSRSRPASSAAAARQREVDDGIDQDEAEVAELEALPALAVKHGRTLHLVQTIYLACAFDLESTQTVLDILKEFDLGTVGLSPDDSSDRDEYRRAMQIARDQILDRVEVIWSPALDRKLLHQRGSKMDAKVARHKNIPIEMVRERREALEVAQGTGIESWYPDEDGFEQWRREVADGDEGEESELEPLDGPAAAD